MDLESQDHILNYQLPVAVKRYNVGLVVIDSITANYRAEHTSSTMAALSTRSGELAKLGHMLRNLAASENLAVVVANQVSDRFSDPVEPPAFARHVQREPGSSPASRIVGGESGGRGEGGVPSSSPAIPSSPFANEEFGNEASGSATRNDILSLLHQQRFFTGWGDSRTEYAELGMYQRPAQKTPALGLVWSTQIASRIALKKETLSTPADGVGSQMSSAGNSQVAKDAEDTKPRAPASAESAPGRGAVYQNPMIPEGDKVTRRVMKLVMAPWTGGVQKNGRIRDEVEFEICKSGLSGRINKDKS